MISFIFPQSPGEWLAWISAAMTLIFGCLCLLAPRLALKAARLQAASDRPEAAALIRGPLAGFLIGVSLSALLFAQPFLWLALGAAWAASAIGRLVSILFDRAGTPFNWICVVLEAALAAMPLAYVLGYV